jgi:hypothetical protein
MQGSFFVVSVFLQEVRGFSADHRNVLTIEIVTSCGTGGESLKS